MIGFFIVIVATILDMLLMASGDATAAGFVWIMTALCVAGCLYLLFVCIPQCRDDQLARVMTITAVVMTASTAFVAHHFMTDQTEWKGTITQLRWRYEWDVSMWTAQNRDCWGSGCSPADAYNQNEKWEDTGARVKIGENCITSRTKNADGTTSETKSCTDITVPVFDWHVYFTINDWATIRTNISASSMGEEPYWSDLKITRYYNETKDCKTALGMTGANAPVLGCELPGGQRTFYWYSVSSFEPVLSAECGLGDFDTWHGLSIEKVIRGMWWTHQSRIDCNSIQFSL